MTNEEMAVRIQQGERDLLPELWAGVERFVAKTAYSRIAAYRLRSSDVAVEAADLIQEGYLAMVRAVETFHQDRGMAFIGWLAFYLKNTFNAALGTQSGGKRKNPMHQAASLDRPLEGAGGRTMEALLPGTENPIQEAEQAIWLDQLRTVMLPALDQLPKRQGEILRRRYGHAQTLQTVGAALGLSRETIRKREVKGLTAMREALAGF